MKIDKLINLLISKNYRITSVSVSKTFKKKTTIIRVVKNNRPN